MVMVARGTDGVYRTQPVETHSNGDGALSVAATDIMDAEGSARWNAWWDQRFAVENENWCQTIARCFDEFIRPLERKIEALEPKLSSAIGAIDILRGKGAPGALNIRGTYDSLTTYSYLDVVALNGGSFIALRDRPGDCPGDGWQLLASAGKRGERGVRGPQGPRGLAASSVKWLSFDSARMALVVTMGDGTSTKIPLAGVFTNVTIDRELLHRVQDDRWRGVEIQRARIFRAIRRRETGALTTFRQQGANGQDGLIRRLSMSESDADASIHQDAPENALAALAQLDGDQLIELCTRQRTLIREQQEAYARLFNDLNELRKQVGDLKALGVRRFEVFRAVDAERDPASPLQ
jgi:hypothetical protein